MMPNGSKSQHTGKRRIIHVGALATALFLLAGCGRQDRATEPVADEPKNHHAEAEKTINAENMDRHLDELDAEISADERAVEE